MVRLDTTPTTIITHFGLRSETTPHNNRAWETLDWRCRRAAACGQNCATRRRLDCENSRGRFTRQGSKDAEIIAIAVGVVGLFSIISDPQQCQATAPEIAVSVHLL